MRIMPKISGACIVVPSEPVIKALADCDSDYLKVLLYVLNLNEFDESDACEYLDITKKTFNKALKYWIDKELIVISDDRPISSNFNTVIESKPLAPSNSIRNYSSDDITNYINNNPQFKDLLYNCEQITGKIFNLAEIEVVVRLVDYLKLDDEYIILLFSHCKKIDKKSIRYLEKLAVSLFDEGILEYDELDSYLKAKEESHKLTHVLREMFGIGSRRLTKKESTAFESWSVNLKYPIEIIELAFEITVENTGNASVPYCDTVLNNWHNAGYNSIEEIKSALEKYKLDKQNSKDKSGSFETDDFFEAALKRSYKK